MSTGKGLERNVSPGDVDTSKRKMTVRTRSTNKSSATSSKTQRSATPPKDKQSTKIPVTGGRSKSESVETFTSTRLRQTKARLAYKKNNVNTVNTIKTSVNNFNNMYPIVVLERYDIVNNIKIANSIGPVNSIPLKNSIPTTEVSNSRIGPYTNKNNNEASTTSPRLDNNDEYESDDKTQLVNNTSSNTYPFEFGGSFVNIILTIMFPMLVIFAKIAIKTKGNLIPFPRGYLRLANYYDQDVFIWTAAIVFLQLLISLVPLAKQSKALLTHDYKHNYYRFSGFINLIIAALIVLAMDYYKCSIDFILEIVTKKTVPHVVASFLYTFIISIILYTKERYINKIDTFNSYNCIQKLFIGTTNNPTLGPINIKLAIYRYSILMTILFNSLVIMDCLKNPVNIHLYFVAGLQIFYAIDKLIFEFNLLSSFYLLKEKDGYWTIIQQFLQPIIHFLPIQILLANNLPVNYIILGISSFIFLIGYICQRYSDFTKYQYEVVKSTLPYRPLRVKIFVDGLWSYVRYPNNTGTIIAHLAIILPVIEPNLGSLQATWPVLLYPLYYIVTLSHQCVHDSSYSRLQHGYEWDRQNTVKWNLMPKIF